MKTDLFYLYGEVDGKFIIIDFATLGELYQEEREENIKMFLSEADEVKLRTFEDFKADCIYHAADYDWEEFYESYKTKYYSK